MQFIDKSVELGGPFILLDISISAKVYIKRVNGMILAWTAYSLPQNLEMLGYPFSYNGYIV